MSHRFLYQNMIGQASGIAALSTVAGAVSGGVPRVANGTGAVVFTGDYTGLVLEVYTVEIDLAGDVGVAKFKWRKTSTAIGAWEATGLLTAATDTALDDGVKVRFADGSASPAFSLGDRWQATATRAHGPRNVIDLDPATKHRSGSPPLDPEALAFDLGAAQAPDAVVVHGHNISPGATVKIQGGPLPAAYAASFDGVDDVITAADHDSLDGMAQLTIEAWIKPAADNSAIISRWGGSAGDQCYNFLISDTTKLRAEVRNQALTYGSILADSATLLDGFWHHAVLVYNGVDLRLYLDGALDSTPVAFTGSIRIASAGGLETVVGGRPPSPYSVFFTGSIMEARIYSRGLSAAEVLDHSNGIFTDESNLELHWKLDEGTGTSAADSSPNTNTGTLKNGVAWNSDGGVDLSETLTHQAGTMIHYPTTSPRSFRHWRIKIEGDAGNPDGRIEIVEVHLGPYFEPAFHFEWGNVLAERAFEAARETESKAERTVLLNRGRSAALPYRHVSKAEKDLFLAMFRAVKDTAAERSLPLFVHLDVDDPAALFMARLGGSFAPAEEGPDDFAFKLEIREALA
ncbi:MAG: LamG domain-containing protein [bacterium]